MTGDTALRLARSGRAYVIAPAGCGKTEEIAKAVASQDEGRQLILTHTHAGIYSLRSRLRKLGVSAGNYRVNTIAGFALHWASAYPKLSGLETFTPTNEEWIRVYAAGIEILQRSAIRRVLGLRFSGVYVDEYQDCSLIQHQLVLALADFLPCRILGDPLQGIFGFKGDQPIDWNRDVVPNFEKLPELTFPWRWKKVNSQLGAWLVKFRDELKTGMQIDLRNSPVTWQRMSQDKSVLAQAQRDKCFEIASRYNGQSIVAILKWPNNCHSFAKQLRGVYTSMEEIEARDLQKWVNRIEAAKGPKRAVELIDFMSECKTQVSGKLKSVRSRFAEGGQPNFTRFKKHLEVIAALQRVAASDDLHWVSAALESIKQMEGYIYRRELLSAMERVLREHAASEFETLFETAWHVRHRTRLQGRRVELRTVSRTLLIKGMEFDHTIVLNADQLDMKNLYVAMTRGARSLTVFSQNPIIQRIDTG